MYLTNECKTRGVTIVYATHIFDAMDRWPTHIAYLTAGRLAFFGSIEEFHKHMPTGKDAPQLYFASKLMTILAHWIRRDRQENLNKERQVWYRMFILFSHRMITVPCETRVGFAFNSKCVLMYRTVLVHSMMQ